jgi:hypothetical protein
VERLASDVIELATASTSRPRWPVGRFCAVGRGVLQVKPRKAFSELKRSGKPEGHRSDLSVPYCLGLKAEALLRLGRTSDAFEVIMEAEALVERSEERWSAAELQRLRALCLAAAGADGAQIEAAFRQAITTAKQQESISLAKRAEASFSECRNALKGNLDFLCQQSKG